MEPLNVALIGLSALVVICITLVLMTSRIEFTWESSSNDDHGAALIWNERERQIKEEGYTSQHDDDEKPGAITMAAITYATYAASGEDIRSEWRRYIANGMPIHPWPWNIESLKLSTDKSAECRIRELTKAGALIAAEIDRLQRKGV